MLIRSRYSTVPLSRAIKVTVADYDQSQHPFRPRFRQHCQRPARRCRKHLHVSIPRRSAHQQLEAATSPSFAALRAPIRLVDVYAEDGVTGAAGFMHHLAFVLEVPYGLGADRVVRMSWKIEHV